MGQGTSIDSSARTATSPQTNRVHTLIALQNLVLQYASPLTRAHCASAIDQGMGHNQSPRLESQPVGEKPLQPAVMNPNSHPSHLTTHTGRQLRIQLPLLSSFFQPQDQLLIWWIYQVLIHSHDLPTNITHSSDPNISSMPLSSNILPPDYLQLTASSLPKILHPIVPPLDLDTTGPTSGVDEHNRHDSIHIADLSYQEFVKKVDVLRQILTIYENKKSLSHNEVYDRMLHIFDQNNIEISIKLPQPCCKPTSYEAISTNQDLIVPAATTTTTLSQLPSAAVITKGPKQTHRAMLELPNISFEATAEGIFSAMFKQQPTYSHLPILTSLIPSRSTLEQLLFDANARLSPLGDADVGKVNTDQYDSSRRSSATNSQQPPHPPLSEPKSFGVFDIYPQQSTSLYQIHHHHYPNKQPLPNLRPTNSLPSNPSLSQVPSLDNRLGTTSGVNGAISVSFKDSNVPTSLLTPHISSYPTIWGFPNSVQNLTVDQLVTLPQVGDPGDRFIALFHPGKFLANIYTPVLLLLTKIIPPLGQIIQKLQLNLHSHYDEDSKFESDSNGEQSTNGSRDNSNTSISTSTNFSTLNQRYSPLTLNTDPNSQGTGPIDPHQFAAIMYCCYSNLLACCTLLLTRSQHEETMLLGHLGGHQSPNHNISTPLGRTIMYRNFPYLFVFAKYLKLDQSIGLQTVKVAGGELGSTHHCSASSLNPRQSITTTAQAENHSSEPNHGTEPNHNMAMSATHTTQSPSCGQNSPGSDPHHETTLATNPSPTHQLTEPSHPIMATRVITPPPPPSLEVPDKASSNNVETHPTSGAYHEIVENVSPNPQKIINQVPQQTPLASSTLLPPQTTTTLSTVTIPIGVVTMTDGLNNNIDTLYLDWYQNTYRDYSRCLIHANAASPITSVVDVDPLPKTRWHIPNPYFTLLPPRFTAQLLGRCSKYGQKSQERHNYLKSSKGGLHEPFLHTSGIGSYGTLDQFIVYFNIISSIINNNQHPQLQQPQELDVKNVLSQQTSPFYTVHLLGDILTLLPSATKLYAALTANLFPLTPSQKIQQPIRVKNTTEWFADIIWARILQHSNRNGGRCGDSDPNLENYSDSTNPQTNSGPKDQLTEEQSRSCDLLLDRDQRNHHSEKSDGQQSPSKKFNQPPHFDIAMLNPISPKLTDTIAQMLTPTSNHNVPTPISLTLSAHFTVHHSPPPQPLLSPPSSSPPSLYSISTPSSLSQQSTSSSQSSHHPQYQPQPTAIPPPPATHQLPQLPTSLSNPLSDRPTNPWQPAQNPNTPQNPQTSSPQSNSGSQSRANCEDTVVYDGLRQADLAILGFHQHYMSQSVGFASLLASQLIKTHLINVLSTVTQCHDGGTTNYDDQPIQHPDQSTQAVSSPLQIILSPPSSLLSIVSSSTNFSKVLNQMRQRVLDQKEPRRQGGGFHQPLLPSPTHMNSPLSTSYDLQALLGLNDQFNNISLFVDGHDNNIPSNVSSTQLQNLISNIDIQVQFNMKFTFVEQPGGELISGTKLTTNNNQHHEESLQYQLIQPLSSFTITTNVPNSIIVVSNIIKLLPPSLHGTLMSLDSNKDDQSHQDINAPFCPIQIVQIGQIGQSPNSSSLTSPTPIANIYDIPQPLPFAMFNALRMNASAKENNTFNQYTLTPASFLAIQSLTQIIMDKNHGFF